MDERPDRWKIKVSRGQPPPRNVPPSSNLRRIFPIELASVKLVSRPFLPLFSPPPPSLHFPRDFAFGNHSLLPLPLPFLLFIQDSSFFASIPELKRSRTGRDHESLERIESRCFKFLFLFLFFFNTLVDF